VYQSVRTNLLGERRRAWPPSPSAQTGIGAPAIATHTARSTHAISTERSTPRLAGGARHSEIWTVPDGPGYAGKPRPAVIIQDDRFDSNSVTMCPFTTDPIDAPLFRSSIEPRESNGPTAESRLMIDKITTVRRSKLGNQIGMLDDADVV
jgi:mRNA interferase MazF